MSGYQTIKQNLLPYIKGAPWIVVILLICVFTASKVIQYTPNTFQSIAKIKLDDQKFGISGNNLFGDFDVFTAENKIEAEAEVLKSPMLISRLVDSLKLNVRIYREGTFKRTLLFKNSPFLIELENDPSTINTTSLTAQITNKKIYIKEVNGEAQNIQTNFDSLVRINDLSFRFHKCSQAIQQKNISLKGFYAIELINKDESVGQLINNLDVKPLDKEVPILRIVCKESEGEMTERIVNELCSIYIADYIESKTAAANTTVQFIDKKLEDVGTKLGDAEIQLENFKKENDVVNTLQETETGLKEISKLKIQLINLEMNESTIKELQSNINNGEYFTETSIAFGFGDLLLTELVKKMKLWQDEKRDLKLKYTDNNPKIISVDEKIEEVRGYIKEGVRQNLKEIIIKRSEIEQSLNAEKQMFDKLPTREKNQQIIEREFNTLESVYNFLSEKKIEANIAASASISFHRLIQPAIIGKNPVSPNRTLILFVSGLLGLFLGVGFIFLKTKFSSKVVNKIQIEKMSLTPILGLIRKGNPQIDFDAILTKILLKTSQKETLIIAISSTLANEGKSVFSKRLNDIIVQRGIKCSLLNFQDNSIRKNYLKDGVLCKSLIKKNHNTDQIILINTTATSRSINAVESIKSADFTVYLAKANHTHTGYLNYIDQLSNEYQLENIYWVLNGAHKASNHSGEFVGSRFAKGLKHSGLKNRIASLFNNYLK